VRVWKKQGPHVNINFLARHVIQLLDDISCVNSRLSIYALKLIPKSSDNNSLHPRSVYLTHPIQAVQFHTSRILVVRTQGRIRDFRKAEGWLATG
jgi:hypothetical protein